MRARIHMLLGPMALAWPLRVPGQEAVDLIVRNAAVTTQNDAQPQVRAFAVRGEKFVAVGGDEVVMRLRGERTRVIDAGGRRIIPGLTIRTFTPSAADGSRT